MNIYFVNDTANSINWGCRATTNALKHMVSSLNCEISSTMPLSFMSQRQPWANNQIERKDTCPSKWSDFDQYADFVMQGHILKDVKEAILCSDIVFINGEGSIYDTQRKGRFMLFVAYIARQYLSTPCVIVNHTCDIHDPIMYEMVENIYPLLDDVIFREPLSASACKSFLNITPESIVPDSAFIYEPASKSELSGITNRENYYSIWPDWTDGFDPGKPYICISGSSIYLRPDRPDYDPIPTYISLCKTLNDNVADVLLVPTDRPDEKLLRPVAKELGLPIVATALSTQQAVDILGNAALFISGRWHPSIMALTGGTPIITLTANTYKTIALQKMFEPELPTFDALNLHKHLDDIVELAKSCIVAGDSMRNKIRSKAQEYSKSCWHNVRSLTNNSTQSPRTYKSSCSGQERTKIDITAFPLSVISDSIFKKYEEDVIRLRKESEVRERTKANLEKQIAQRNKELESQKKKVAAQKVKIKEQRDDIGAQRAEIIEQRDEIGAQRAEIIEQRDEISAQRAEIKEQRDEIDAQNKKIKVRMNQNKKLKRELSRVVNSRSWKITRPLRETKSLIKSLYKKAKTKAKKGIFFMFRLLPIKSNFIVFESHRALSYSCNPKYIYEAMLEANLDFTFVWFFSKLGHSIKGPAKQVKRFTIRYYYYLARAKFLIHNAEFAQNLPIRKKQIYINTQHGTPLKKMGTEMISPPKSVKSPNYTKDGRWSFLITQNNYSTNIFRRALCFNGPILELGYPRNDIFYKRNDTKSILELKEKLGLPSFSKVILYAPTWRGNKKRRASNNFSLELDIKRLYDEFSKSHVIILRLHHLNSSKLKIDEDLNEFAYNFSNSKYDIQELCLVSDILITDYSSVMFDYANLNRPQIFYTYDLEHYKDDLRGLYFDIEEEGPGPVVKTMDELIDTIENIDEIWREKYNEKHSAFHEKFCYLDDGRASERVIDQIIKVNKKKNKE